jgi:hypothetical protein
MHAAAAILKQYHDEQYHDEERHDEQLRDLGSS